VRHGATLADGRAITPDLVRQTITEQLSDFRGRFGDEAFSHGRFELAGELFQDMMTRENFNDFLTLPAYEHID
jgi:malate synthase